MEKVELCSYCQSKCIILLTYFLNRNEEYALVFYIGPSHIDYPGAWTWNQQGPIYELRVNSTTCSFICALRRH